MNLSIFTPLLIALILSCCCFCRATQLTHAIGVIREGSSVPSYNAIRIEDAATETTTTTKQALPESNTNSLNVTERNERTDAANDGNNKPMVWTITSRINELQEIGDNGSKPLDGFWNITRRLWTWISTEFSESQSDDRNEMASRTFGAIRRMQVVLIPLVFKFGVLSAMIAMLVFLGLKTVFLLKILLMINVLALMGKLLTWKWRFVANDEHPQPILKPVPIITPGPSWVPNYMGWNSVPAYHGAWGPPPYHSEHHPPSKEVHLHIHGTQLTSRSSSSENESQKNWAHRNGPYATYEIPPDEGRHDWEFHPSIQTGYGK